MVLKNFNFLGKPAYRFLEHDGILPEHLYSFMGKDFDVKSFKGNETLKLNEKVNVDLVNQTHSTTVVDCSERGCEADGFIVRDGEIAGVMTADCTPVIIYSEKERIGSVIHCGWMGTFADIVQIAVSKLKENKLDVSNSLFLIGPAAQKCCYNVQPDFLAELHKREASWFKKTQADQSLASHSERQDKIFVSIPNLINRIALELGFSRKNIFKAEECTICDQRFFSYRKDGSKAGRQLSILNLKNIL